MEETTFDAHLGRRTAIDIGHVCHSFWFDTHESLTLTPGSTLKLFRIIGEKITRPERVNADLAKCPRCKSRLRRTHDIQRNTKFEYLSCPHTHGRLTTFFDFLREKNFIRPLTPQQIDQAPKRTMDCIDCHNRPTHIYLSPNEAIDRSLTAGRLDVSLPFIKARAVEALSGAYSTNDEALAAIERTLTKFLRNTIARYLRP
jgi:hypothetical protein